MSPPRSPNPDPDSEDCEETERAPWPSVIPLDYATALPSFPVDAFPAWVRSYVRAVEVSTQTPVDLASMLALSVLATVLTKNVTVQVRTDWSEPVNAFVLVSLGSGERKSAVFRAMAAPIEEREREVIEQWKRSGGQGSSPRLLVDDVTPEALASLMAEQDGKMALLSAEGGIFDTLAGRYSDGRPNFEVFLKGHAGDTLRVDRKGRPPELVNDAALILGITVQPDIINGLMSKRSFRGRGLLARFWYSLPTSKVGTRDVNPPIIPIDIKDTYKANITKLFDLQPVVLELSEEARTHLLAFQRDLEPRLGPGADLSHVGDWANKLPGAIVRIAGLLHGSAAPSEMSNTCIGGDTMRDAIRVGDYLLEHALAAFDAMGADPTIESAKKVLGWLCAHHLGQFTVRDAHQTLRGTFKKVGDLYGPIALLIEHGYLREAPLPKRPGPGRPPSPRYEVNPAVHPAQNPHNPQNLGPVQQAS